MKTTTRLGAVLVISLCFFCAEIGIGFQSRSLALIADAFHYLNDIVAYLIAFVAAYVQNRKYKPVGYTYALHRAELVGAFFNGVFLLALALSIFLQSIERFITIEVVDHPLNVLIIGCVGLTLNILSAVIVHDHHGHGHSHGPEPLKSGPPQLPPDVEDNQELGTVHEEDDLHALHNHVRLPPPLDPHGNLGVAAVFIHVLGDAVNNVGVIIAAAIMMKLESPLKYYADPAASMLISLIIFASAIPLTLKSGRILLEASPSHLNLDHITDDLLSLEDVSSIHDLHIWQLSQSVLLASVHVGVPPNTTMVQWERMEARLRTCLAGYGVSHVTLAPEAAVSGESAVSALDDACRSKSCGDLLGCSAVVGSTSRTTNVEAV